MKVKTTRFGTLEVDENKIIAFFAGIPGFEKLSRFLPTLLEELQVIYWFQGYGKTGGLL
ncbi:MAG: hypothetical protein H0Z24_10355 [Thermosipho sp. (in: Bacteria)]|nr:hypothetical protein [Thermosipho sp. (in: thermotogales)]